MSYSSFSDSFKFLPELSLVRNEEDPIVSLIEGDNLPVLEGLRKTHEGSVDVVYIDPPYNTKRRDLTYKDSWKNLNGHESWLEFMKVRLEAAKHLMSDEGVIFVSIDDKEQAYLKVLMDSVFGEKNFISNIIWVSKSGSANDSKTIMNSTEYILVYAKNKKAVKFTAVPLDTDADPRYKYEDEYVEERGRYTLDKMDRSSLSYSKGMDFPIEHEGMVAIPGGTEEENARGIWSWKWGKKKVQWGIENGFMVFKVNAHNTLNAYTKQYQKVDNDGKPFVRSQPHGNIIRDIKTLHGNAEIRNILGRRVFSYPKPVDLIKRLVGMVDVPHARVMDFFVGSGSTAHAVMKLNEEDGQNRECIVVTNNEGGDENPDLGISRSITQPRIVRALTGENWADGKTHPAIPGNLHYYMI